MSYVLSVIRPPAASAAFGRASVSEEVIEAQHAGDMAGDILIRWGVPNLEARAFGNALARELTGTQRTHTGISFTFRIDPADQAPHPCPCCQRLVLPTDHAQADAEDALCLGCFTWRRDVTACLPANTAHTEEP